MERTLHEAGSLRGKRAIFLVGPSGSGKSVLGRKTANSVGWPIIDTDEEVLKLAEMSTIVEIFEVKGEAYFRSLEVECLTQIEQSDGFVVVATGGGLPSTPGAIERMSRVGVPVYLRATLETLWKRLQMSPDKLAERPLLRNGGEEALSELIRTRENTYLRASMVFDTDQMAVADVVAILSTVVDAITKANADPK